MIHLIELLANAVVGDSEDKEALVSCRGCCRAFGHGFLNVDDESGAVGVISSELEGLWISLTGGAVNGVGITGGNKLSAKTGDSGIDAGLWVIDVNLSAVAVREADGDAVASGKRVHRADKFIGRIDEIDFGVTFG